ncbi:MAG: T9SS type A sorting domain-containing protein [Chitinophagales bacterium]
MTKIFTFPAVLFFCSALQAQDFAEDWTQTDCAGVDHTLFTELDAGNVVIMEFVMPTGCVPCITAAENIGPLVDDYNVEFDNRVKYYTFGYNEAYTCATLDGWAADYSLNPSAKFSSGTDILAYYGSMGMPTIVIVGGLDHAVHYEKMGFLVSNMDDIEEAIIAALGTEDTSTTDILSDAISSINVFPNPAAETIVLTYENSFSVDAISLMDLKGNKISGLQNPVFNNIGNRYIATFDISSVPNGIYFIQFTGNGISQIEKVVVNH